MCSETDPINKKKPRHHPPASSSFRWNLRRRRRVLPTVRLGGKKPRSRFSFVGLCEKAKEKWLKLKYLSMRKEVKKYYKSLVNDIMEGKGTIELYQKRMLLETSFAVPILGVSFNTCPSSHRRW